LKQFLNSIFRVCIVSAALGMTSMGASASLVNLTATLHGGPQFTATGGGFGGNSVTPGVWQVNFDTQDFYAFSLDPTVAFNGASNHYTSANFIANDATKRLYETYYTTVLGSNLNNPAPKAKAFQLALWELNNDNGNLLSGNLRFANLSNAVVADANAMLSTALGSMLIHNTYQYTSLSSIGAGVNSQKMLTVALSTAPVSAIPEPGTYALLFAGLGMLGLLARFRSKQQ